MLRMMRADVTRIAGLFLHGRRPRFDEQDCLDGTLIKRVDLAAFEEVGEPLEERVLLRAHGVDSIAVVSSPSRRRSAAELPPSSSVSPQE